MADKKVIFIELDGGSWDVINPLIKQGKLPNIKRLKEHGASGELISDFPFISPRIWTSIFTGKHAEKHGIDFFGANSQLVKCKRIWDIFEANDLKIGIFGSLITWPPRPLNGFMIPSISALEPDTYPEDYRFFQEIALNERRKWKQIDGNGSGGDNLFYYANKLKSNGVTLATFWDILKYLSLEKIRRFGQKDKYWRRATIHLRISTEVFLHLHRLFNPNFSTFHIHLCDTVSHRYWMFYESDNFPGVARRQVKKYRNVIPNSYIEADKAIGKILSLADQNTIIVVASDHGFKAVEMSRDHYTLRVGRLLKILDIDQKVIVMRFGIGAYLYFQDEQLMRRISNAMGKAHFKETGENMFYVKPFGRILIVSKPSWRVSAEKIKGDSLIDFGEFGTYEVKDICSQRKMPQTGIHDERGILIMSGPNIKKGSVCQNASIFDITPTILLSMDYPVAKDMDGRVLTEIFKDDFTRGNPIKYIESYEEPTVRRTEEPSDIDYEKLRKRLAGLGYL